MSSLLAQRLALYSAPPDANGCVLWTGSRTWTGYPRVMWRRRNRLAHRSAWIVKHGPIPAGLNVCHHCDVPACINVDHLFLGTQADNVADMISKGRFRDHKGDANNAAKLKAEQVLAIREDSRLQREIAEDYKINQTTVSSIKRRAIWAHVL